MGGWMEGGMDGWMGSVWIEWMEAYPYVFETVHAGFPKNIAIIYL